MKNTIKSLTLSIDELSRILLMDDPEERRQVLAALTENVSSPESLDVSRYSDSSPITQCIVRKISRRVEMRRRRREKIARKKASLTGREDACIDEKPGAGKVPPASLELNKATVGRLLWIKQNHKNWLRAVTAILDALTGSEVYAKVAEEVRRVADMIFGCLKPLIDQAAVYHQTPARFRPRFAAL